DSCTQVVLDAARDLDGVVAERILARTIPQAKLTIDAARAGISAREIAARLREGDPSIRLAQSGDTLMVNPHNLADGEAELIAHRLRDIVRAAG
ncbi:MAG: hypothetical protein HY332_13615, partial [Chloroflexi bacterium]|nr:hypothetical protein [Chloroflexota bacterium]